MASLASGDGYSSAEHLSRHGSVGAAAAAGRRSRTSAATKGTRGSTRSGRSRRKSKRRPVVEVWNPVSELQRTTKEQQTRLITSYATGHHGQGHRLEVCHNTPTGGKTVPSKPKGQHAIARAAKKEARRALRFAKTTGDPTAKAAASATVAVATAAEKEWATKEKIRRRDEQGFDAVDRDDGRLLESLLALGLPVDCRDERGHTLLIRAATVGSAKAVEVLLAHSVDLDAAAPDGNTALHVAKAYGHTSLFDTLIQAGADDSLPNLEGLTCYEGLDSIEMLVKQGMLLKENS